jgi:GxxExxY protein
MDLNVLSSQVIKAAISVHTGLGPGLLESVYQKCMAIELESLGINFETEVQLPVNYRGKVITDDGFRIDIIVEESIVVELKSVEMIKAVHKKQLLTYLRLSDKPLGLLINFNEALLKDGITRIVNQKRSKPLAEPLGLPRKIRFK